MFKKSFLTILCVLSLVLCLTVPSFAGVWDNGNLVPYDFNQWHSVPDSNFQITDIIYTESSNLGIVNHLNWIKVPVTSERGVIGAEFFNSRNMSLSADYDLTFMYKGHFDYSFMRVYIVFDKDYLMLNKYEQVLEVKTNVPDYQSFHVQFNPSNYDYTSINGISLVFTFEKNITGVANIYLNNVLLTSSSPIDSGSWTGPTVPFSDIDISNELHNLDDNSASLFSFLTTGFASARKGIIGVSSLFSIVWNYLQSNTPAVPYVIIFGLSLGLFCVILSVWKFGKSSNGTSKSSKGGNSKK